MALVSSQVGNTLLLRYMLNNQSAADVEIRLYSNDVTPSESDVLGTFTESTASNYSAIRLSGAAWTVAAGPQSGSTATYAQQTFTMTGAGTFYGYFCTSSNKTNLLWGERFTGAPFVLPSGGGSVSVVPRVSLD